MPPLLSWSNRPKRGIALVGNPGTGKSTIVNGLLGTPLFNSGYSAGTGLTKALHEQQLNGVSYFDTPGLNDPETRVQAGAELDKLLREDVSLKLVFVVTVSSGRVRPEDITTIGLVLDAITSVDTNDRFAVVINQVSPRFVNDLETNQETERMVRSQITGERHTSHWCYVKFDYSLVDVDNAMLTSPEINSLLANLPETRPAGAVVRDIDTASFDEKLQREMKLMAEKERKLKEELERQKEVLAAQILETDRINAALAREREEKERKEQEAMRKHNELQDKVDAQNEQLRSAGKGAELLKSEVYRLKEDSKNGRREAREQMWWLQYELGATKAMYEAQTRTLMGVMENSSRSRGHSVTRTIPSIPSPDASETYSPSSSSSSSSSSYDEAEPYSSSSSSSSDDEAEQDTLRVGDSLRRGECLLSKNGRFAFGLRRDGNVVIVDRKRRRNRKIWESGTGGKETTSLKMRPSGNLKLCCGISTVWSTETAGSGVTYAVMQEDGNFVLYEPRGPAWASGSWQADWRD